MLPTNVNRLAWQTFIEDVSTVDSDLKMTVSGLLDQVSITGDASDNLWYTTSVVINPSKLHQGNAPSLSVEFEGHALHVGLKGESMNLAAPICISSVDWTESSLAAQMHRPLTWYKAYFNAPQGSKPLAIDMKGMGKGQVSINGKSIRRY
ncbi:glycoside hydrolase, family 35 [Tanacetum coccineum]|uniref:Glycoside hydrolase, family 35 n=1 Tax=Tanacetum coccineum TaxID=301880 RepID=A0ABQ5C394_9ASTR